MYVLCICGKLCTSKAGLTLHQRGCKLAIDALAAGTPTVVESHVESHIEYIQQVREMVDLVNELAFDADKALKSRNKSAGRRARINLLKLRDMIVPMREEILEKMKE